MEIAYAWHKDTKFPTNNWIHWYFPKKIYLPFIYDSVFAILVWVYLSLIQGYDCVEVMGYETSQFGKVVKL